MSLADNAAIGSSSMWTKVHGRWKQKIRCVAGWGATPKGRSCGRVRL